MQVLPADLAGFPGAPFAQDHVDAVVAQMERTLGWHVSPSRAETLTVRHGGGPLLMLPSRNVTTVSEVRVNGHAVSPVRLTSAAEAMLEGYWAPGVYEVDVVHGFDVIPADLLAEVARSCVEFRTDRSLASWSSGPFSATLRGTEQRRGASAMFWAYSINGV